jgi:hypothetical protein
MRRVMASLLALVAWNATAVFTRMIDLVSLLIVHTRLSSLVLQVP